MLSAKELTALGTALADTLHYCGNTEQRAGLLAARSMLLDMLHERALGSAGESYAARTRLDSAFAARLDALEPLTTGPRASKHGN